MADFFGQQSRFTVLNIIITIERRRVEAMFAPYRTLIGNDFDGYRNHVYRCVTYAMHFLGNATEYEQIVETAFVYHDIGLWTDKELAYLEPSEALALLDNDKYGWGLAPDSLQGAIHWHHKIFKYKGVDAAVIEACRKADWIDATQGWCRKGISRLKLFCMPRGDLVDPDSLGHVLFQVRNHLLPYRDGGWLATLAMACDVAI